MAAGSTSALVGAQWTVSQHARDRRIEIEFDAHERRVIKDTLLEPRVIEVVDATILSEIQSGVQLSSSARRIFMHPGREADVRTQDGLRRVNSTTEYVWSDHVCYVIENDVVITTIAVTDAQYDSLRSVEQVRPPANTQISLRAQLQLHETERPSNESGLRAKALLLDERRAMPPRVMQTHQPFTVPTWMFRREALLTIAVIDPWYDGYRRLPMLKQWLDSRRLRDQAYGVSSIGSLRVSHRIGMDRLYRGIGEIFDRPLLLPELPSDEQRVERASFERGMYDWWNGLRSDTSDLRFLVLITADEARSLVETLIGSQGLRKFEGGVITELRKIGSPEDGLRAFGAGRIININFARSVQAGGNPEVSWSQFV